MSEEVSNSVQEVNETVELAPEAHENAEALSFDDLDSLTDGRSDRDLVKEISKKPNEQGMIDLIEKISQKENLID